MIGNVLYLSTMYTRVAALDVETGDVLWIFDPGANEGRPRGAGLREAPGHRLVERRGIRTHLSEQPRPAVRDRCRDR